MKEIARRILLESGGDPDSIRLFSDRISLAEGATKSVETLCRVVKFDDWCYGEVELTKSKFNTMIKNFNDNVYGQDIAVDISHMISGGAGGFIRRLFLDGNKLRAEIEWTDFGKDAVLRRGFRYFSIDFHEDWKDPETGDKHGPVLMGAALTTRPRVKRLDPINPERLQLSFDDDDRRGCAVSPRFAQLLTEEITAMWEKLRKQLEEKLKGLKLGENIIKQLTEQFNNSVKNITDEEQAKIYLSTFEATAETLAKQLADSGADGQTIKLDFSGLGDQLKAAAPAAGGLDEEGVKSLIKQMQDDQAKQQKQLQETRENKLKLFREQLDASESVKALSDESRKTLSEVEDLITADMSEDHVKKLAEHQIKLASDMAVAAQLASRGFDVQGTTHITVDESNKIKELQETVDRRLGILDMSESRRYASTGGSLPEENKKFAEKVLAKFDRDRGAQLHAEHKMLAGGDGNVSDVNVPTSWERTVIREALYQLVALQFVNSDSVEFNSSYTIPYSYRDTTGAGRNDTRRYEGQSINRAGVIQTAETAYNIPQKLAFAISDELRYLTAARHLNWDAVAENQQNASRIVREDLEQVIFNEVLHAADEYSAVAVVDEDLGAAADGTNNVFPLANFPVVRPRNIYDLQGNQVGNTVNPITVTHNAVDLDEYDGTGTQAAGTYWQMDYNLGELRLVDETGAIVTPAGADTLLVDYSYSTNVYAFDTDLGTDKTDEHWDKFLYRYGLRKSVIEDDRFHMANFGVMSGTAMTQIEQAKQFGANSKRPGTDLMADGNLGRVKDVPNFKTAAPGLWIGDQRVIVGERGISRFRMAKPWQLGQMRDQVDANGRFTGKKEAYGDQFVVVHTPTQLKRAYTSLLLYSDSARVARAE